MAVVAAAVSKLGLMCPRLNFSSLCNQVRPWSSFWSSCLYLLNAGFRHVPSLCLCSVWTIWGSRVRKESTLPNWSESPAPHNWRTKIDNKKVTVLNQTNQTSKRFLIPNTLNSHILALSVFTLDKCFTLVLFYTTKHCYTKSFLLDTM